ncbi:orotate phosphoribosyltransferase [Cyclonatronum proteinivorum]|uniref:Orotate phosphoribosyltransferase n=1 Tax=Cyclonatronum proteinivorum TaxID=1457365 RepID=A0A345UK25_9BACT|nr:orotate phosphoribosyltransferase [Cyclonatronum proteinivorum]AXJ00827.1 orotate phosphoribosyltransferase [Cyclonatronum proteinivorum]
MIINPTFAKELAISLLEINAVILRPHTPFRWTSGWNSPIYCDNRLTLRFPELRAKIADEFTAFIRETYPDTDVIAGTSTAGIPHAAWIADRMNKPMAYVRSKPKQHGTTNQIEGGIQKGEKAVIIEDLVSTGESAISVAKALQFIGVEVLGIVSIFNYGFTQAASRFEEKELKVNALTNYDTLLEAGVKFGFVAQKDLELLTAWRQDPETWPKGL